MEGEKEEFLKEFGSDYGYPNGPRSIDEIRATEFKRLEQNGIVYLDHAGATLYSELQMQAIFEDLSSSVYGNPHSQNQSSSITLDIVKEARQQVLEYFNASPKEYKCVFTSGATAALKLVGEAFPWSSGGTFMYTMENHNSVLGIREYALSQGAASIAVDLEDIIHFETESGSHETVVNIARQHQMQRQTKFTFLEREYSGNCYNLFAFPSECNFSGMRFNLDLVKLVKEKSLRVLGDSFCRGHWMVLIDAAKGCATKPPDLASCPADFVVVSFYKLFGYPTGLGALIVQNDAASLLKKAYFSGGTVAASFADVDFVKRRAEIEELFEDGTCSFLGIASIRHGFKILNSLTASMISRHTTSLALYVKKKLMGLKHDNDAWVCKIYEGCTEKALFLKSGPVVAFNLKRKNGFWFGYREVEKLASLSGIQLRTGCFCNPGACAKYLGLSHVDLLSNLEAGHVCWDDNDIINGKPTGAIRVSFGYMSTYEDAKKLIDFIRSSFLSMSDKFENDVILRERSIFTPLTSKEERSSTNYHLKSIIVFPIKSCGGFSTESWPLCSTGLLHDREWLLKSLTGEILTQKRVPKMCFISTYIDLKLEVMFVECPQLSTKLKIDVKKNLCDAVKDEIELHSKRYKVWQYEDDVNLWFSNAIGFSCYLLRVCGSEKNSFLYKTRAATMCRNVESKLNFANEAPLLLVSEASVSDLNSRLRLTDIQDGRRTLPPVTPSRFRPNLVVSGGEPYAEDDWKSLRIGNRSFTALRGCSRCELVNLVPNDEFVVLKTNEPLKTLASYRRSKGKIMFGILLRCEDEGHAAQPPQYSWLQVGQQVRPS